MRNKAAFFPFGEKREQRRTVVTSFAYIIIEAARASGHKGVSFKEIDTC